MEQIDLKMPKKYTSMENYNLESFKGLILIDTGSLEKGKDFFEEIKAIYRPSRLDPQKTNDELHYTRTTLFPLLVKNTWTIPEVIQESESYREYLNGRLHHFKNVFSDMTPDDKEAFSTRLSQLEILAKDTTRIIKILKKKDILKNFNESQRKRYANLTEILKISKRAERDNSSYREEKYTDEKLVSIAIIMSNLSDVLLLTSDKHLTSLFNYMYNSPENCFHHKVVIYNLRTSVLNEYEPKPRLIPKQKN